MSAYVKSTEVHGDELTIVVVGEPASLRSIAWAVREGLINVTAAPLRALARPANAKLQDDDRTPFFVRCSLGERGCRLIANHPGDCDPIEGR